MSDVLQAFISQGGSLLGYEYFTELRIAVGSGDDADLFLDAPGIEPVHAWVERSGKRITVRAEGEALVLVNRVPVGEARLRGFDEVSIGPYSVKFKAVRAGATPVPAPPVPGAPAPSEPYLGASSGVLAVQPTAPISPAMLAPLRVAVEQESESESETESETESESETETESETELPRGS